MTRFIQTPGGNINYDFASDVIKQAAANGTYKIVDDATPINQTTPTLPTLSQTQVLPGQVNSPGDLLSFKDTISKAVNLAKEKRNAMSVDFMAPHRGTVAASDFNSILGNLNKASDTFAQDVTKNSLEADANKKLTSETIGNFEVLRDGSGKVVFTRAVDKTKTNNDVDKDGYPDAPGETHPVAGAPTWEEYLKAAQETARMSFTPESQAELKKQYEAAYTAVDTSDFTKSEKRKLEQAGLLNKSRKEQLDHLYKKKDSTDEEELSDEEFIKLLQGEQ